MNAQNGSIGKNDSPFNDVLKLADIARPRIARQRRHGFGGNGVDRLAEAPAELLHKVADQKRDVLRPFAQRRDADRKYIQPIIQVRAELALGDKLIQVAVRRCDQTRVRSHGARRTKTFELALLQDAQELGLQLERYIADLVEKNRAAIG